MPEIADLDLPSAPVGPPPGLLVYRARVRALRELAAGFPQDRIPGRIWGRLGSGGLRVVLEGICSLCGRAALVTDLVLDAVVLRNEHAQDLEPAVIDACAACLVAALAAPAGTSFSADGRAVGALDICCSGCLIEWRGTRGARFLVEDVVRTHGHGRADEVCALPDAGPRRAWCGVCAACLEVAADAVGAAERRRAAYAELTECEELAA